MHPIQIALLTFALFASARVVARLRSRALPTAEALLWMAVWLGLGAATLMPSAAQTLADLAGVGRGVDVIIYLTLAMLLYAIFRLRLALYGLESQVTALVRALALERVREPKQ